MKRDLTGNAVDRANGHMKRALAIFAERIPLGPSRVSMSQAELRRMYAKWSPDQRTFWINSVGGYDIAGEMLDGVA